jgi:hypothetical protein
MWASERFGNPEDDVQEHCRPAQGEIVVGVVDVNQAAMAAWSQWPDSIVSFPRLAAGD